ncbi:MAG TPA: Gfo/Idh/MocA family oxidoreductase [Coriobacteriia bacterium]|nr:Gfo/Idh/MocA family oxidoreductase [Coriobacteriia bacterium]
MNGDKLVVGLIGYGYWGPNILRNYAQCADVDVKWVADRDERRLEKAHVASPGSLVTTEANDIFADEQVDAVLLATPISTHYPLGKSALLAGKHVFIEKPLAASVKEAETLVEMAERRGRTLMVGHTFEFSPAVRKIKDILDSGELGDIYFIASSRVNLGLHQKDVSVIWDLAPHDFSILFYWLGEEASQISSFGRSCVHECNPDVAFVNMAFPSGTVAEIQLSWLSPVKLRRTMVVGSRKMLLYDDTESVEKVKIYDHGVNVTVEPGSYGEFQLSYRTGDIVSPRLDTWEPLLAEAQHFIESIKTGTPPRTDGLSGLRVVRALERAEQSLMMNRTTVPGSSEAEWGDFLEIEAPIPAMSGGR